MKDGRWHTISELQRFLMNLRTNEQMGQLIDIDQLIIISGVINALLTSSFSSLQLYAL